MRDPFVGQLASCVSLDCIIAPFAFAAVSSENRVPLSASTRCSDGEKRSSRCSITRFMPLTVRLGSQKTMRIITNRKHHNRA